MYESDGEKYWHIGEEDVSSFLSALIPNHGVLDPSRVFLAETGTGLGRFLSHGGCPICLKAMEFEGIDM